MEEVQSWWEVPAVAHFCYIFRAPFNLFFFEIAELESALLNIQDPDMSISLEQLVTCLLQGCYDTESVNEDNWEEKLHELFNDNFEGDENPLGESYFLHLSPRSKIEVLLKLCELRLDVDGALDEIKNIPSEEMQAKCIGKDSQNNAYWYFTNERLYRESSSSEKKTVQQPVKNKNLKNDLHKNSRQSTREKRNKKIPNIDAPWSIVCFTINDWEQLSNSLSKSKKSQDKELSAAIKEHLPLLQERVAEKDRLLRKRFLELAPKRTSSRISRVQEMKKLEELKAAEEERKAQLKAEKERAKKEALLLKKMKESRQRRAEERRRAIEERAERAKLRELMRDDSDSSEEEEDDRNYPKKVSSVKSRKVRDSRGVKRKRKEESDNNNESDEECPKSSYSRTRKVAEISRSISPPDNRLSIRTYSNNTKQSENSAVRGKKALKDNPKYLINSSEVSSDISLKNKLSLKSSCVSQNTKKIDCNDEFKNKKSRNNNSSNNIIKLDSNNSNCGKTADLSPKQNFPILPSNSYIRYSQLNKSTTPPKISIYKPNVLSNTSDMSKWNAAFDSKRQKVHILYKSSDNLAPKRIKLEQVNFRAVPPSMKSSLTKENHLYKPVQFITYGKIIPSPTLVKLGYKKPPNQPVSS